MSLHFFCLFYIFQEEYSIRRNEYSSFLELVEENKEEIELNTVSFLKHLFATYLTCRGLYINISPHHLLSTSKDKFQLPKEDLLGGAGCK